MSKSLTIQTLSPTSFQDLSNNDVATPGTRSRTLDLTIAAAEGKLEVLQQLFHDADRDGTTLDTRTALQVAAEEGHLGCVQFMLQAGVDVNAKDRWGTTALQGALAKRQYEVARLLRTFGATDSGLEGVSNQQYSESTSMNVEDISDRWLVRKAAVLIALPFLILLLLQGTWFLLMFLLATGVWLVFVTAFLVSEVSIKPPWYHPNPSNPEKGLYSHELPEYWQGIVNNPKYDLGLDYEEVSFKSDSYTLRGWWIPAALPNVVVTTPGDTKSRPPRPQVGRGCTAVICVHGGGRDRRAFLRHVTIFHEQNYPVLLFDLREHGISSGNRRGTSYGLKEKRDVSAAVRYVKEGRANEGIQCVVVVGTSVGGASVLMAAAEDPNIDVVIAENPMTKSAELLTFHIKRLIKPYFTHGRVADKVLDAFCWLTCSLSRLRMGGLMQREAIDVVQDISPRALLLMHGTVDEVIPYQHSQLLYQAARQPKQLWLAQDAFHCGLFDKYPIEYQNRVIQFIQEHEQGLGFEKKDPFETAHPYSGSFGPLRATKSLAEFGSVSMLGRRDDAQSVSPTAVGDGGRHASRRLFRSSSEGKRPISDMFVTPHSLLFATPDEGRNGGQHNSDSSSVDSNVHHKDE